MIGSRHANIVICFQVSRENNSPNLQYIGYIGMGGAVGSQLQYVEHLYSHA